jgi:hypothetical protein
MILYYQDKDLLLDVVGSIIKSVITAPIYKVKNGGIELSIIVNIKDMSFINLNLIDLFIVYEDPDLSIKMISCNFSLTSNDDDYYTVGIICKDHFIGRFKELEHIYRDRKIDLIL